VTNHHHKHTLLHIFYTKKKPWTDEFAPVITVPKNDSTAPENNSCLCSYVRQKIAISFFLFPFYSRFPFCFLLLVNHQHLDDGNQAYFSKFVVVLGEGKAMKE